jgi:predicted N-acetyltransferase YhbS
MSHIRLERPDDGAAIELLVDRAFGPDRKAKTVYKLRAGQPPVVDLCFVAIDDEGKLVASIRYWPVIAGGQTALLLGPLSVEPAKQGQGFGKALMRHSLAVAKKLGHGAVILVGDPDYYQPFGFRRELALGLRLPGWVDERRFLGLELVHGALKGALGEVSALRGAKRQPGRPAAEPTRPLRVKAATA